MAGSQRQVIVDNTNTNIQYTGPWFQTIGGLDNLGSSGPPFRSTSHGVSANASLSYTFHGTQIAMYGTLQGFELNHPTWDCRLDGSIKDGTNTESIPLQSESDNNLLLCDIYSLPDGQHTIDVEISVFNSTNIFWFDRFNYLPSANVSLDNSTVLVDYIDPDIQYGFGWALATGPGLMTEQPGSSLTLDFIGIQLSWFGIIPETLGNVIIPSSATYSIDGATPVSFSLNSTLGGATLNHIIFQTGRLSPGRHHLEVVHSAGPPATPLTLYQIVIQNATDSSALASDSSGAGPLGPPIPALQSDSPTILPSKFKFPTGALVGGVLGSFMVIAILIFLFLRRRARKTKTIQPYGTQEFVAPPPPGVEPFNSLSPAPVLDEKHAAIGIIPAASHPIQTTGKFIRADQNPEAVLQASHTIHISGDSRRARANSSFPIQTTGKVVRADQDSGITVVVPTANVDIPPENSLHPAQVAEVSLPEGEEGSVVELPPLYTLG